MGNNRIEKIKDLHLTPINKHKRTQWEILLWILNKWHPKPATVADFTMKDQNYTMWVKKQYTLFMSITSRNINPFSKFFHCHTQHKICYEMIDTYSGIPLLHCSVKHVANYFDMSRVSCFFDSRCTSDT